MSTSLDGDSSSTHTSSPISSAALRPGATRQRLDRYTATVIEDLRQETDTKIDALGARITQLENTVQDLVGITGRTPDMFQNMSELVRDLADQQKEIMGAMKDLASAVGQMMNQQAGQAGNHPRQISHAKPQALLDDQASASSSTSTDLSLHSLSLNAEAGPSTAPQTLPAIPGANRKGKGKSGRKR